MLMKSPAKHRSGEAYAQCQQGCLPRISNKAKLITSLSIKKSMKTHLPAQLRAALRHASPVVRWC